jgi:acetyltransferase-like isoleucine patch superfamily enzyme
VSAQIAATAIIHPHVRLGKNVVIEDFCIIGTPFKGWNGEETIIGDDSVIRSHTVIYAGNRIGNRFQTGNKANIRELNLIGDDVSIGTLSIIEHHVTIANKVRIHSQVFIPEYTTLDESAWIGPNVAITNAKFPQSPNVKAELKGAKVGRSAKIGANSTLLPAVIIGDNSLIGAGSVVTKDVSSDSIVAGNPAKFIRKIHY